MILSLYPRDCEERASDKLYDKYRKYSENGAEDRVFDRILSRLHPVDTALTRQDKECAIYKVRKSDSASHTLDHGE